MKNQDMVNNTNPSDPMDKLGVVNRVVDIIASNVDDKDGIQRYSMIDALEIDSVTFIKIIVEIEQEFEFEFDDDMLAFANYSSIESLGEYVFSKISSVNNSLEDKE